MITFATACILLGIVALFIGLRSLNRVTGKLERVVGELEKLDWQQEHDDDSTDFALPGPAEFGWDCISVSPAKRRCMRKYCFGGPPTYFEVLEYDLRPQNRRNPVFARLVDMWEEDYWGDSYQVVNGAICERANEGNQSDNLEKRIVWHELLGPERYVILSAHGIGKEFFIVEQERIQKALTQLRAGAEALGAIQVERDGWIRFEARPDADEEQKSAIKAGVAILCSEQSLGQLRVTFREVFRQDCAYVLNEILGKRPESVTRSPNTGP
jgi:hypothetical protein